MADVIWPEVTELNADPRVERVRTLANLIEEDICILEEKSWRQEMREIDILAAFWLANSSLTDGDTKTIDILRRKYRKCSQNTIKKHLNDLEGTGTLRARIYK